MIDITKDIQALSTFRNNSVEFIQQLRKPRAAGACCLEIAGLAKDSKGPATDEDLRTLEKMRDLRPVCLQLAAMVTEVDEKDGARLREVALPVSGCGCWTVGRLFAGESASADRRARGLLSCEAESLRDSGSVALSHTLPHLLANACYALLRYLKQWTLLHRQPELIEQAVEELMRYAGLSRYLYRRATEDMTLAGVSIA